jgi:nucleoside phosphorylase
MLAFVIAIHREAEGLIAHFGLSKDMHPHPFAIYRGESVILTVSGVGKLNAAMATTYLLSLPDIHRDHVILVNYGCCASWSSTLPIGYLSAAVKVTDSDTHHDYFSDLASYVIPHVPLSELVCLSSPFRGADDAPTFIHSPAITEHPDVPLLFDMESAGFCHAAGKFLHTYQYLCLKVVTDYGLRSDLSLDVLDQALHSGKTALLDLIERLVANAFQPEAPAERQFEPILFELSQKLRLTHQMQRSLALEVRKSALMNKSPEEVLSRYLHTETATRQERRVMLDALISELRNQRPI